jgi:hypothetical protein
MTTEEAFDWGELPEEWWIETATSIGAKRRMAMFAAAKHAGKSNTEAARLSGCGTGSDEAAKAEGYRVARSNKVMQLLALAVAQPDTVTTAMSLRRKPSGF